ncbi:MAG: hypothetical protein ACRCXX_13935 [Cetobacterium sp.]|uniref:hypothetical protein n=1 Tax=Cetobacterium sp. TaxID=2071632 RepID=UPI003F4146B5
MEQKKIKEACNLQFVKDLFFICKSFDVLSETADEEIIKRTFLENGSILIRLQKEETKTGDSIEFKYEKKPDGFYEYLGFKVYN